MSGATVVAPLETMAWLASGAAVKDDVKAAPLVPKPMSAEASLVPGLMRKYALLLEAMRRLAPLNVATRPAACNTGLAAKASFSVFWRSAPERELPPVASPPDRSILGMAMEGPPLIENSRCAVPAETVLSYAVPDRKSTRLNSSH